MHCFDGVTKVGSQFSFSFEFLWTQTRCYCRALEGGIRFEHGLFLSVALRGGCSCSAQPKLSFAQILSPVKTPSEPLPLPTVRGDNLSIKITEALYSKGLERCRHRIHGRLFLNKGDKPYTAKEVTAKLSKHWKTKGTWELIPLGRGFYEFKFSNDDDMRNSLAMGTVNLKLGLLRLSHWPMRLLKTLNTWIKKFIWSGDINTRKVCTVAWKKLCKPWDEGGLDLRSTQEINAGLLLRLGWRCYAHDSQWSHLFHNRFFVAGRPLTRHFSSSIWPGIPNHFDTIIGNSMWIVGSGENINMWSDTLLSLLELPDTLAPSLLGKVSSLISNGQWDLPHGLLSIPLVADRIHNTIIPSIPLQDKLVWLHSPDGDLPSKQAYAFLHPSAAVLPWASIIWRACIPPSHF